MTIQPASPMSRPLLDHLTEFGAVPPRADIPTLAHTREILHGWSLSSIIADIEGAAGLHVTRRKPPRATMRSDVARGVTRSTPDQGMLSLGVQSDIRLHRIPSARPGEDFGASALFHCLTAHPWPGSFRGRSSLSVLDLQLTSHLCLAVAPREITRRKAPGPASATF